MTDRTQKTSPIRVAAQEDPAVSEAMHRIEQGTRDLYRALTDLGDAHPRLHGALLAIGPDLCAQAVKGGQTV